MAYTRENYKTKKALKDAVKNGPEYPGDLSLWSPGPWPVNDGKAVIEGPQYPKPHRWYASVMVEHGAVVRVIS